MNANNNLQVILRVTNDDVAHYAFIDITGLPRPPRNPMICEMTAADLEQFNTEQLDGKWSAGAAGEVPRD